MTYKIKIRNLGHLLLLLLLLMLRERIFVNLGGNNDFLLYEI